MEVKSIFSEYWSILDITLMIPAFPSTWRAIAHGMNGMAGIGFVSVIIDVSTRQMGSGGRSHPVVVQDRDGINSEA